MAQTGTVNRQTGKPAPTLAEALNRQAEVRQLAQDAAKALYQPPAVIPEPPPAVKP